MARLPPRGPVTPMSSPTLLLVTEDHQLHMCYLRTYIPSLRVMKCSLTQPSVVMESQPQPMHDLPNGPGGIRVCTSASIGLAYNGIFFALLHFWHTAFEHFCRILDPCSHALSFISITQRLIII